MIIVEGCDGTGKTTLVQSLSADLNLLIGKRLTVKRDEIYKTTKGDTYRALAAAVEGLGKPLIWDRIGTFSDPIYGRVLERESAFTTREAQLQIDIIKALGCPIIICTVPFEIAQENMERSEQLEGVDVNFEPIYEQYEIMKDYLRILMPSHTFEYDYREEGAYNHICENILKPYLVTRKDREWQF